LAAIVCVLGTAQAVLAGASAEVVDPVDMVRTVAGANPAPADSEAASHDTAVRQVVLGIISFTHWPTTPVRLH
ncbi:hypothetical protein, partial [Stenotrophomonas maltophilia]